MEYAGTGASTGTREQSPPPDGADAPDGPAGLDGLLREVRRQAAGADEPEADRLLGWLRRRTGVHAAVVADGSARVESATDGFPHEALGPLAPLLARLSGGELAAAATEAEGASGTLHIRCEALGPYGRRPVLVVASADEPGPGTGALISHTGSLLALLHRAADGDRTRRGYHHKAHQVRFAVLHALLVGDPLLARRMTTGAVPPLLDGERMRLHLLRCPPSDRDRICEALQDPSGYHGASLMVQCPVFKEHLICLVAEEEVEGGGPDGGPDRRPDGVSGGGPGGGPARGLGASLRRLVRENPTYAMGVSGTHPLGGATEAYGQAAHALVAARTAPDRIAHFHGRTSLEGVLPHQQALAWAHALLRPLESVPRTSADITHMALTMPRSAVARLLGLSRNTVAAHLRRAERALGHDLADVRSRADVHLAVALSGSCTGSGPENHQPPASLDELLRNEAPAAWARAVLRPLEERHLRTLRAWVDANTDAQRAARRMDISRNTVRAHLRTAESQLGLDLLTTGTGVHDLVLALRISGADSA
ncbi:helix-turn-helix domain-containing protein [Streptomyces sp. ODS28]|uniref:helix-turn-helix domain-containing protein n=1 Tax=Streptomyces sp. ODS28 TaxID=3136688 RepID=UPI0031E59B2F